MTTDVGFPFLHMCMSEDTMISRAWKKNSRVPSIFIGEILETHREMRYDY